MAKLEALKRLRYPRGPDGKEYVAGDSFEASDRDAQALKLVRAAKDAPAKKNMEAEQPAKRGPGRPRKNPDEGQPETVPLPVSTTPTYPGIYSRRDMRSED